MDTPAGTSGSAPSRRKLIIIAAAVCVVLVATGIFAAILLLRQSATVPPPSNVPSPVPSITPPSPGATSQASRSTQSIAVKIKYSTIGTFRLSIIDVTRASEPGTTQHFAPGPGQAYSVLELRDIEGKQLTAAKISLPTQLAVDALASGGGVVTLPENEQVISVRIPAGVVPAEVAVVSATGSVIDSRRFTLSELPFDFVVPTRTPVPLSWRNWLLRPFMALAATQPYIIAVINDSDASPAALAGVVQQTEAMAAAVLPWPDYDIEVIPVANSRPLNCEPIEFNNFNYPRCGSTGYIMNVVAQTVPNWDAILVVTSVQANAGSVESMGGSFLPVVALGSATDKRIITHELGHATGKLADEYMYQIPGANGPPGPNCFNSFEDCRSATSSFPEAACSAGCNNSSTYRPSDRVMRNVFDPLIYGPFEECEVEKVIAAATGTEAMCGSSDSNVPPQPAEPLDFWGWHR